MLSEIARAEQRVDYGPQGEKTCLQDCWTRKANQLAQLQIWSVPLLFICNSPIFLWRPYAVKPVLSCHSKIRPKIVFQDRLSLNAGQKYCRMLQGEHSAILSTFIKLPFVFKTFVLSIFEWPLKTGFAVIPLLVKSRADRLVCNFTRFIWGLAIFLGEP